MIEGKHCLEQQGIGRCRSYEHSHPEGTWHINDNTPSPHVDRYFANKVVHLLPL